MNKTDTFEQFLSTQSVQVDPVAFAINLVIAGLLAFILSKIYARFGEALSNRRSFSKNLVLVTMITMTVISIVKSSLALSLGLVGALSIVRFRAAIKEPEELTYLFLAIAIGLGLGADQRIITITAFVLIIIVIMLRNIRKAHILDGANLYITISSESADSVTLASITEVMNEHCKAVDLKRLDANRHLIEATYNAGLENVGKLQELTDKLKALDENIRITFLDQEGVIT